MPELDGCILLSGLFIKREDVDLPLHVGTLSRHGDRDWGDVSTTQAMPETLSKMLELR